jgi:tetratricopeptide (TPR) repeat protein
VAVDAAAPRAIDAGPRAPSIDAAVDDKKAIARDLAKKARRELSEGNYESALALIDQALENRRTPDAYVVQADVLRRLKRTAEAVEACELAIELRPGYASAWKMKGNILWGAGRQEEARPALEKYLELEPDGEDAESIRARLEGR